MYLCVDSDTVLDQHAVAELAEPFSKRRVHCVTGLVLAHNRGTNLLTRLIDMRYVNAFLGERVAYSRLGSVLCACGSLAMYRGWVVRKYVDDFLGQRFLGQPATFGDDRRLTYYCLTEGLSLIQPSSVGYTDVPERLGHYIRQQIRWGKSFIREGFLLLGKFRLTRMYWWLNLVELVTWVLFTGGLLTALIVIATHPTGWRLLAGLPRLHVRDGVDPLDPLPARRGHRRLLRPDVHLPLRSAVRGHEPLSAAAAAAVVARHDAQQQLGHPCHGRGRRPTRTVLSTRPSQPRAPPCPSAAWAAPGHSTQPAPSRQDDMSWDYPVRPGMPVASAPGWNQAAPLHVDQAPVGGWTHQAPPGQPDPYAQGHPAPPRSGYTPEHPYGD